uniref:ATP synthase F0 subunit 8 n=1 Tax=Hirondellea gigas TaxID=1518452 RepID=A0A1B1RRY6_9CRUS|nr:ATP synthase F0 subunit 8 [Hirondellea gigas]
MHFLVPQMAPVMWLPLFILLLVIIMWIKSLVYFYKSSDDFIDLSLSKMSLSNNWLW